MLSLRGSEAFRGTRETSSTSERRRGSSDGGGGERGTPPRP
jgi:hypothetical protein